MEVEETPEISSLSPVACEMKNETTVDDGVDVGGQE